MDIQPKFKEAELYYTHGLLQESLQIFEDLLSASQGADEKLAGTIRERIETIKKDIHAYDTTDTALSSEEASIVSESLSMETSPKEILTGARSLSELGMHKEAAAEYGRLLTSQIDIAEIMPGLMDSLFAIHPPSRVIDQVNKIIAENHLAETRVAEIKFFLGKSLTDRDQKELALELFESVKKMDPEYPEIDKAIEEAIASAGYESRYDYLLKYKIVNTIQLQNALGISKKSGKSVEFVLIENFNIPKEEIGKSLTLFYRCPFKSFDPSWEAPFELIRKLKKTFLIQNAWVPLTWDLNGVEILIDDPTDLLKTDQIPALINSKKLIFSVGIREDIEKTVRAFFEGGAQDGAEGAEAEDAEDDYELMPAIDFEEEDDDEDGQYEEVNESSGQIVRLVDQILISAYRKGCSDIHVEPSMVTKKTSIRYRIDGVCQEVLQVPNSNARALLSRLKIMAGLDIAERRLPQDGKIKFRRKGVRPFELRLATLPTSGGFEDAVLRILAESGAMKIEEMGMNERNLSLMKKIIVQPYGLVLVVGPTGSGKTTTLHACLGYINKPGVKIWTAEDPVEITQHGLRQVEAKPKIGLDFPRIMRAFLRADRDIIMIGEMRDHETAAIGIEASLTGHLVFSTLHTNSAPETVTRLLDMGLNPLNFSDAFLGVLAQRLIRRLCKSCRKKYHPTEEEFQDLVQDYGETAFRALGVEYGPDTKLHKIKGCEECSNTGYRGRLGAHELMYGSKEVKRLIKREAETEALFEKSSEEGMTTIRQDALTKVLQGLTDVDEVRRVCIK